jgi:hypothetical protein
VYEFLGFVVSLATLATTWFPVIPHKQGVDLGVARFNLQKM